MGEFGQGGEVGWLIGLLVGWLVWLISLTGCLYDCLVG